MKPMLYPLPPAQTPEIFLLTQMSKQKIEKLLKITRIKRASKVLRLLFCLLLFSNVSFAENYWTAGTSVRTTRLSDDKNDPVSTARQELINNTNAPATKRLTYVFDDAVTGRVTVTNTYGGFTASPGVYVKLPTDKGNYNPTAELLSAIGVGSVYQCVVCPSTITVSKDVVVPAFSKATYELTYTRHSHTSTFLAYNAYLFYSTTIAQGNYTQEYNTNPGYKLVETSKYVPPHHVFRAPYNPKAIMAAFKTPHYSLISLVAHRGLTRPGQCPDGYYATENSIGAIDHAVLHGYEAVELDVRASRDGQPVLAHDKTYGRQFNVPKTLATYWNSTKFDDPKTGRRFIDIKSVNFAAASGWQANGDSKDPRNLSKGETVIVLRTALEHIKTNKLPLVVELDVKDLSLAKTVVQIIRDLDMWGQVAVKSILSDFDLNYSVEGIDEKFGFVDANGKPTKYYADRVKFNFIPVIYSQDADIINGTNLGNVRGAMKHLDKFEKNFTVSYAGKPLDFFVAQINKFKAAPWFLYFENSVKEPDNKADKEKFIKHFRLLQNIIENNGLANGTVHFYNSVFPGDPKTYWGADGHSIGNIDNLHFKSVLYGYEEQQDLRTNLPFVTARLPGYPGGTVLITDVCRDDNNSLFSDNKRLVAYYTDVANGGCWNPPTATLRGYWNCNGTEYPNARNASDSVTVSTATAITKEAAAVVKETTTTIESVQLYPNPAHNSVSVAFYSATQQPASVELLDMLGNVILKKEVATAVGNNKLDIDTAAIPSGLYVVHIQVGSSRITKKLLIEK